LRTGKYDQAIELLSKYSGGDPILSSVAIGAIGDCNLELNKNEDAIKYYLKAANNSNNSFTTPHYLQKAGFVYELNSNFAEALKAYQRIQQEFPSTTQAREMDKNIARVKAAGNL
jgi:tetratricopeptide (TPR) repeat protein